MLYSGRIIAIWVGCAALLSLGNGCVQRTLSINTDPPGALVFLNDQEIGRTPLQRDFTWYGDYDMQIRKDGYQTINEKLPIHAPLWQVPPIDFFAELWPGHLKDERHFNFNLKSATTQPADPDAVFARAFEMRGKIESSQYTAQPATRTSTTAPAPKPATQPIGGS